MEQQIPLWITSIAAAVAAIYSIWRNGSRSKKKDDQLKTELKSEIGTIQKSLSDPNFGLGAIKKEVSDFKVNCASVSTALSAQVRTNAEEIANLRKKKRSP